MNEVDIAVVLIIGICIYHGVARGLMTGAMDFASLLVALACGAVAWRVGEALFRFLGFPHALAGLGGFVLITAGISIGTAYLGFWLLRDVEPPKWVNRIGGGIFGLLFGLLLSMLLLIVSGIVPNAHRPITQSALGPRIASLAPTSMTAMERAGIALPKLVMLPTNYRDEVSGVRRGLQFMQINFSQLEGATCMKCRSHMHFLGYKFKKGTLLSPKFRCPNCGRTTDGCQTFEGFHTIYGRCPIDLAREGITFDCGVWTNGDFITPKGPCTVDGKTLGSRTEN